MSAGLRFIQISPDWCGERGLAQIFRQNGHKVACHDKGALAEDILFARARGKKPLRQHRDAVLLAGLHRVNTFWRVPLEGWRDIAYLDRCFPKACFILTTRDPDAWLLDRMTRDKGVIAQCYAHHLGLSHEALLERWSADFQSHIAAVTAHFRDDPRLIRVDIDRESPADLARRLRRYLPMPDLDDAASWFPRETASLASRLDAVIDHAAPARRGDDTDLVEDVAAYCLKGLAPGAGDPDCVSNLCADWDGGDRVINRQGKPLPFAFGQLPGQSQTSAILRATSDIKLGRAEGVINDILRLGRRAAVRIDMQDARPFGGSPEDSPPGPVLCYNRRSGARNAVLWPLPGQHEIGAPGSVRADCPDVIPFDEKEDRLVWRGHISGSVQSPPGEPSGPVQQFLVALQQAEDDPGAQVRLFGLLSRVPRLAFLRRWIDHPDMDLGMTLSWRFRDLATHPMLAPYARPREGPAFFHRFRYQLTLSGYDHGSNFIGAINAQSVLLKEEDGWEVYYLCRFKPWQHYIPVARFCTDIEEKLDWARANPDRCKQMSQAARAEVARLANPQARQLILSTILDGISAAR